MTAERGNFPEIHPGAVDYVYTAGMIALRESVIQDGGITGLFNLLRAGGDQLRSTLDRYELLFSAATSPDVRTRRRAQNEARWSAAGTNGAADQPRNAHEAVMQGVQAVAETVGIPPQEAAFLYLAQKIHDTAFPELVPAAESPSQ